MIDRIDRILLSSGANVTRDLVKLIDDVRRETIETCAEWVRHEEGNNTADSMIRDLL